MAAATQPMYRGASPLQNMFDTLFAEQIIFFMILLGILFAGIGGIMFYFAGTNKTVFDIGYVLNVLGFVFIGVFLLMGGLANKLLDKNVRLGMIIGGALMLTFTLGITV